MRGLDVSGYCVKKPTTPLRRGTQLRAQRTTVPAEKIRGKESKPKRGQTVPPAVTRSITRRASATRCASGARRRRERSAKRRRIAIFHRPRVSRPYNRRRVARQQLQTQ